jgi:photosynthetic reaction center cytochrome c subunit
MSIGRGAAVCAWSIVLASAASIAWAQGPPAPAMVDTPSVTVLTGLTVPEFEAEMQLMNQALGVSCGHCHARGNFASEANLRKASARKMLEMTKAINHQFFPDYKPAAPLGDESRLGKVTCFTCHQGSERPKAAP